MKLFCEICETVRTVCEIQRIKIKTNWQTASDYSVSKNGPTSFGLFKNCEPIMLIMPSSAWWKCKRLRYKPLENRVYNGNSNWLSNTASKIQCYNTKPRSWDPSSASDLRLADKHLTTDLTDGYRFGVFVVSCFFFFFFSSCKRNMASEENL